MKKNNLVNQMKQIGQISLIALMFIGGNNAFAGERGGNGGGKLGIYFSSILTNTLSVPFNYCSTRPAFTICSRDRHRIPSHEISLMQEAAKRTKIKTTYEPLIIDGDVKDAINNGIDEITFNLNQWLKLAPSYRIKLVLHEYATIAGLEESDSYEQSNQFYQLLESEFNPDFNEIFELAVKIPPFSEKQVIYNSSQINFGIENDDYIYSGNIGIIYTIELGWRNARNFCISKGHKDVVSLSRKILELPFNKKSCQKVSGASCTDYNSYDIDIYGRKQNVYPSRVSSQAMLGPFEMVLGYKNPKLLIFTFDSITCEGN